MLELDKSSMFYWYPKIKYLDIPQPKTEMYRFNEGEFKILQREEGIPKSIFENILPLTEKIGFPLFMRTDNSSCKHGWKKTCYVPSIDKLDNHIMELLTNSAMQGWMSYCDKGLALRKYVPLITKFTAFYGEFPVNKERRYFIKDGRLQCRHPYWYPDAIENPSVVNWSALLDGLNRETPQEVLLLTKYAQKVADIFDGYWSVDFAKGKNGKWYLIDMAEGEKSFHWLECKYCTQKMREQYNKKINKEKVETIDFKKYILQSK